jgi:hypothetical protein
MVYKNPIQQKRPCLGNVLLRVWNFEKEKTWFGIKAIEQFFYFFLFHRDTNYEKDLLKLSSKLNQSSFDNFPDYLSYR